MHTVRYDSIEPCYGVVFFRKDDESSTTSRSNISNRFAVNDMFAERILVVVFVQL